MQTQSISTRFNLTLAIIVALIMLFFAGAAIHFTGQRNSEALDEKLDNYINISRVGLEAPMWNFDFPIVEGYLDSLVLDKSIVFAGVTSTDGSEIVREMSDSQGIDFRTVSEGPDFSVREGTIIHDGNEIGIIRLVASREALRREILTNTVAIGIVTLLVLSTITLASVLISRRYIVKPLADLQKSASAIGAGNLETPIKLTAKDEIGQLAGSFSVMRESIRQLIEELRNANETLEARVVERTSEVTAARQKLVDAIGSTSEGFAFFNADDTLILHNDQYLRLLYGDSNVDVAPGMSFEEILRLGIRDELIDVEAGDPEEFIQKRLELHRNPVSSILQKRGKGKWIQISETKTSDGGTVAVFSDVSELKLRETELTEKTVMLENLSNQLAKYLSPQIYASIFEGTNEVKLAANRKKLTVFFSDIEGFTETAERMESEELTSLLNNYLTEMSKIAIDHGATIDKYVGDAIVIFFGDPDSNGIKEDALACAKMAIAMSERMTELQDQWRKAGILEPLKCRIGIHTDYCTVGNFGSESRMDYTIIGRGVNTAARLESAAEPGQILVSYATHAHISDEIPCESRGKIEVKGIPYPIEVFEVSTSQVPAQRPALDKSSPKKLTLDVDALTDTERKKFVGLVEALLSDLSKDGEGGEGDAARKS
ncbi:adenylate/guanylate cyclase domain-containing protein [uncultured Roseibium sp.]|uniref:adenylate/guanylate cyclase domain-containing protein n=1 Tax=uncultured Roseibium sp. TaxID=1936171 RepID=UPI002624AE5D|nr:adenylate/guanylate cyclase domain-containing protein [uncultured Roseibium sp.]